MPTNEILPFADSVSADVLTQVAYSADPQRLIGHQIGIARQDLENKVLRQTSFMSVALAQLIVDNTGSSVLDDGDDAILLTNMKKAVNGFIGSNIASATTTTIGVESSGDVVHVTGTTTITSLGTSTTGTKRTVIFDGILTLTHNATSLILPSAANITTSAGSAGVFICTDGALGYWKCTSYSDDVVSKAQLKTYFDTLYSAVGSGSISGVRQTVQSGSIDANGYGNFVSIGTLLSVNIAANTVPLKIHTAGGDVASDRLGTISADTTISGLTASNTNYLFAEVATDGTVTLGKTILKPLYQQGGAASIVLNQYTFNISEMKMYVGNGTTASQVYGTFIGHAVTNGTNVTSVVNYALNGEFVTPTSALLIGATVTTLSHNLGMKGVVVPILTCLTAQAGIAAGDELGFNIVNSAGAFSSSWSYNEYSGSYATIASSLYLVTLGTASFTNITPANFNVKFKAMRGW